jgi:hypothetical protein
MSSVRDETWVTLTPYPYRDGNLIANFAGNKLPGYDHAVPTGRVQPV